MPRAKLSARVYFKLDERDKVRWEARAEAAGMTLSEWMRDRLRQAALREKRKFLRDHRPIENIPF